MVTEIIKPRNKPTQFDEKPYPWHQKTVVLAAVTPSPKPAAFAEASPSQKPAAGPLPSQKPLAVQAPPAAKPVVVAALAPRNAPAMHQALNGRPSPNASASRLPAAANEVGEGDIGDDATADTSQHPWMIQIGAFATQNLARAQLAAYAEKSMDVLGQAARVVAPFQAVDGHTAYRARFGPFAEREAREVCSRLSQRGQTCFTTR